MATSLGGLSAHDWNVLQNAWAHGIDYNVSRLGKRHWQVLGRIGKGAPLFTTKTAAWLYGCELVRRESEHRWWVSAVSAESLQ